ncbi:MAG TPA: hypothetical protein VGR26_02650 [Acidimicrobiales bacterium]|nr:hypothetical protein [Acidimicrobiales bacterium]
MAVVYMAPDAAEQGGGPRRAPPFTPTFIAFEILLAIGNAQGYAANYDPALDVRTAMVTFGMADSSVRPRSRRLGPGTSECKSIRIDRTGLTVGRQFLPAGEVGHCALLPEYEAGQAALKCRTRTLASGIGGCRTNTSPTAARPCSSARGAETCPGPDG